MKQFTLYNDRVIEIIHFIPNYLTAVEGEKQIELSLNYPQEVN
jgi:hypothetical protein